MQLHNPYVELIKQHRPKFPMPGFLEIGNRFGDFHPWPGLADIEFRFQVVKDFSWAIPSDEAIALLVKYSPIVEIGSGSGYWAHLVRQAGGDIVCYDKQESDCHTFNKFWIEDTIKGDESAALKHPDRTLFLCWPPYSEPMAFKSLKYFNGDHLIYIGESGGGCTGCDRFHKKVHYEFEQIERIQIPNWFGIHDDMRVYRRKRAKAKDDPR